MTPMVSRYLQAFALLAGTIIGVGVFALPYVISGPGYLIGMAQLAILAFFLLLVHLMYGDVALSLPAPHQLPGYAKHYLGGGWRRAALFSQLFSFFGSLVVYVILGSRFISILITPLGISGDLLGVLIFFAIGSVLFWYDRGFATTTDALLTALLILAMAVLIVLGIQAGNVDFISYVNPGAVFLPYGAILFALAGASVIPRVKEIFEVRAAHPSGQGSPEAVSALRLVIIWGTLMPAAAYAFFVFAVLAASPVVSMDAISGLLTQLGPRVVWLGGLVGFLATITSFIGIGLALKSMLVEDVEIPRISSWLLVSFIPFGLVLLGVSDFISLIGLIGAFAIGFEGMIIIRLWRALETPKLLSFFPRRAAWLLFLLFLAGIIYEVIHFLR